MTTDYYPYGMPMATSTGSDRNRYKYSGKELETSAGLNQYDFEARQYAPAIPLFQSPDPKAADYPWLNPYLYCAANPMRYIDPTGEIIQITNFDDQEIFRKMFNKTDREHIQFDSEGYLIQNELDSHESNSWIYNSIKDMNSDDNLLTVDLSSGFDCMDNDGNIHHIDFGNIDLEGTEFEDTEFQTTGVTTGETGNMGKTLFPGKGISGQNSIDKNIHVHVNKSLSEIGSLETMGHEIFGHGYLYFITGDRKKASHQFAPGLKDMNTTLVNMIIRARKEIINNQK